MLFVVFLLGVVIGLGAGVLYTHYICWAVSKSLKKKKSEDPYDYDSADWWKRGRDPNDD